MKKILTFFLFLIVFILFSSCTEIKDSPRDSFGFKNITEQTKEEILEKISFYTDRLLASSQRKMSLNKSLSDSLFSVTDTLSIPILRDDLPPKKENSYDFDMIDPIFVREIGNRLKSIHERLILCEDFVEDQFCTIKIENTNIMIKVRNEEDELYIEYITFSKSVNTAETFVGVTMIYLNLIDDKIRFEEVQESKGTVYGEELHVVAYNLYNEFGDIINTRINMLNNRQFLYNRYDHLTRTKFWLSNNDDDMYFSYTELTSDNCYSLQLRDEEIIELEIDYELYNFLFRYTYTTKSGVPRIILTWDLLQVSGWDNALISGSSDAQIFIGDVELLEDFNVIIVASNYTEAKATINVPEDQLTESLINLSDYGLSFTRVTLEQLNLGISFIENSYVMLIEMYGFFLDMEKNTVILDNMIPFYADEDLVKDLVEKMLSGYE